MRTAVGAVYHTLTLLGFENAVPAVGIELALVDHARDPVGERGDDPVRRSRDPAGICSAPEDVAGVEVERQLSGDRVRGDRVVDVHRGPSAFLSCRS